MSQFTHSRDGEIAGTQQDWLIASHNDDQLYDDWWAGTGDETIDSEHLVTTVVFQPLLLHVCNFAIIGLYKL